jgi:hypothetical protein
MNPWNAIDFAIVGSRFLAITKDPQTIAIWENGYSEGEVLSQYRKHDLMGNKLVEMIRNSKTTFDQQTKLDFGGILLSFGDTDIISLLINGEVPTGFVIQYAASDLFRNTLVEKKDYSVFKYPENSYV